MICGLYELGLWKHIRKGWGTFPSQRVMHLLKYVMVLESNFSTTNGVVNKASKKTFPDIFDLVRAKDPSVADLLFFSCGFPQWNVDFIGLAQDWELEVITNFFALLCSAKVIEGTIDEDQLEPLQER